MGEIKTKRALRVGSRINNSTSGKVLFSDSSSKVAQDSDLFWDDSTKLLTVGSAVPLNDTDATNKKYIDDQFPVTHASTTGQTTDDHHAESHTIVSHSDTTGTGAELDELTDGSVTALHSHGGGGGGNVNTAANLTDNAIVRGDGGVADVQTSLATINDAGVLYSPTVDTLNGYFLDGTLTLFTSPTATRTIALGYQASLTDNLAPNCTAIGYQALKVNTGIGNTAVGSGAAAKNTSGASNTAIGHSAMSANTIGGSNVALGRSSLLSNTEGTSNMAIGFGSLQRTTTANNNVAVGVLTQSWSTTGPNNVAIGYGANYYNIGASSCVAIGTQAGWGVSGSGSNHTNTTLIGYKAGYALRTGSNNLLLGYQAGDNLTTGGTNIVIGYNIDSPTATNSNTMTIGNLIFGTGIDGVGTSLSSGNVGIATTTPLAKLHIGTGATTTVGQIIQGVASQSADLSQWRDSNGTVLLEVQADGELGLIQDSKKMYFGLGRDMSLFYDGTDGNIKTDEVASSDLLLTCGANKTLELQNVVYNDIYIPLAGARVPAANAPTWSTFSTNLNSYTFGLNDYTDLATAEITHDYKEGTDIDIHVHFITNGANDGTERKVQYQIFYSWGNPDEAMSAEASSSAEFTIVASEADKTHHYIDVATITGTNYEQGSLIKIRLKRIAGTGTEPANDPFVEMIGIHYQINTLGSRQKNIK